MKIPMKPFVARTLIALAILAAPAATFFAQDGPPPPENFDPAQMRQRELDRIHEALEVTDNGEWKVLSQLITQVLDLNRSMLSFGGVGGLGGPRPPGHDGESGARPPEDAPPDMPRPAGFPAPQLSMEAQALREAVNAHAPSAELKQKLAALVKAKRQQQAKLAQAQAQLREVLSARQEAIATTLGLL